MRLYGRGRLAGVRYQLATLALGPILALQGSRVRRTVPRLPEPEGARSGIAGSGQRLRLLLAGDSATAGVGAAHQSQALSGQLIAALSPSFCVSWRLIARSGIDAGELLAWLEAEEAEAFDVALVSVGVNDATGGTAPVRWRSTQEAIVGVLEARYGVRRVVIAGIPPLQAFPALPQPLRWYLGLRAARLNRASRECHAARANRAFVPFDLPHDPGLFAADGFHPGPEGYRHWGLALAERIGTMA